MLKRLCVWTVLSALCVLTGCGGKLQGVRPSSDFTEEHARYFEDGFDFVKEPGELDGQWLQDWQKELEKRVNLSDAIAVVTVTTLRTDVDPDRKTDYRVIANIESRLFGLLPDDELTLEVHEQSEGYNSVHDNQRQYLNRRFVAYVKWYEDDEGDVAAHWHLSPASEGIVERTKKLVEQRTTKKKIRRKVVVHRDQY
jgi:hypothetical protein